MLNGFSDLVQLHPASRFGGREHRPCDFAAREVPGGQDLRMWAKPGRRKPTRNIRRAVAAAAMLVAFVGVLATIS